MTKTVKHRYAEYIYEDQHPLSVVFNTKTKERLERRAQLMSTSQASVIRRAVSLFLDAADNQDITLTLRLPGGKP